MPENDFELDDDALAIAAGGFVSKMNKPSVVDPDPGLIMSFPQSDPIGNFSPHYLDHM